MLSSKTKYEEVPKEEKRKNVIYILKHKTSLTVVALAENLVI